MLITPAQKKHQVLVAEDDDISRFLITSMLEKEGYDVLAINNGALAVSMFKQNPEVSVVFMDIKMPVMNGLEATRLIREMSPETPVIAATAFAIWSDEAQLAISGFNHLITKPFDAQSLTSVLKKLGLKSL
ncbi:MAG TPA: response regulator [Bacteroidales bacterium]|nr:response regulator [Bacteroidales bacterium]